MEDFPGKPQLKPKDKEWRLADILAMVGIAIVLLICGGGLFMVAFDIDPTLGELPVPTLTSAFSMLLLELVVLIGAIGTVGMLRRIDWMAAAHLRPMSRTWWGWSLLIGVLCIPLVNIVAGTVQQLLGRENELNPQLELVVPEGFSWPGLVGMAVVIGLLIPFAEELFFRGVLFTWLRQYWSFLPAALVTSLVFGSIHALPFLIVGTAVLGFASAWAMEKSGSLWAAVVIHALNNTINVILAYVLLS